MDFTVRALDTRDRFLFEAGPYESVEAAQEVADDFAGAEALPTMLDAQGRTLGAKRPGEGVIINRVQVFGNGPGLPIMYDSAALDFTALVG